VIDLRAAEIKRILGIDVQLTEVTRILTALEFKVEPAGNDALRVTTPPNRLDIQAGAADLIEEVARIYGYDRVPATLLADPLPPQTGNADLEREERVRDRLVDLGLQEVITYSLTTPEREAPLAPPPAGYVTVVNPISTERSAMRHTILAGVLEVVAFNLKHTDTVKVFEVGSVYLQRDGVKLPDEPRRLAVALSGKRTQPSWQDGTTPTGELEFYDVKGVIELLVGDLTVSFRPATTKHLHPGRSADLLVAGTPVGSFGELHPTVTKAFEVAGRAVLVGEFDLEAIMAAIPGRFAYQPVPRFPAALRDVAVVVPEDITAERVLSEVRTAGGALLRDVRLFDLYRGSSIPPGTKSLAFALTYQADDRTLTDKEVDKAHKKIEDRLVHVLKGAIRGKE
jgi:phenylalanyl-tRNA synthetase beta chain